MVRNGTLDKPGKGQCGVQTASQVQLKVLCDSNYLQMKCLRYILSFCCCCFKSVLPLTVKKRLKLRYPIQCWESSQKGQTRWMSTRTHTSCWKFLSHSICFKRVPYSFHLSADWMFVNTLLIDLVLVYWTKALYYHGSFSCLCCVYNALAKSISHKRL